MRVSVASHRLNSGQNDKHAKKGKNGAGEEHWRGGTKNPSSWGTALEPVSQGPAARGPQPSYGSIAAIKDLNGTWASGPSAPRWAIVALPARNKVWAAKVGVPRLRGTAALQVRNDHEEL
jgi:hypothetical protein